MILIYTLEVRTNVLSFNRILSFNHICYNDMEMIWKETERYTEKYFEASINFQFKKIKPIK